MVIFRTADITTYHHITITVYPKNKVCTCKNETHASKYLLIQYFLENQIFNAICTNNYLYNEYMLITI